MAAPPTSLEELATRFGHYRWVEQRLFEILGGWVPAVAEPESKLLLRSHAFRHAWYSQLWEDRLPRTAHLHPDCVTAESLGAGQVLGVLAGMDATADRLSATYEVVLPHLLDVYRSVSAPEPLARWLRIVMGELGVEMSEGIALTAKLGGTGGPDVATVRAAVEEGGGLRFAFP